MGRRVLLLALTALLTAAPAAFARPAAAPDPAFGFRGTANDPNATAVGFAPDGGVVTGGPNLAVHRFGPDGRPLPGFPTPGLGVDADARVVTVTADGSTFVAGSPPGPDDERSGMYVAKVRPDGTPDPTFGGGVVAFPEPSTPVALIPSADGGTVVGLRRGAVRIAANGLSDPNWGFRGQAAIRNLLEEIPLGGGGFLALARPDDTTLAVQRYTGMGWLDDTFGRAGVTDISGSGGAHIALLPGNGVAVVNSGGCPAGTDPARCRLFVHRLAASSDLQSTHIVLGASDPAAVTAQADGRLLVAVGQDTFAGGRALVRVNADGRRDATFGSCGSSALPKTGQPSAIGLQPSGRILQAGLSGPGAAITALTGGAGGNPTPARIVRVTGLSGSTSSGLLLGYSALRRTRVAVTVRDGSGRVLVRTNRTALACRPATLRLKLRRAVRGRAITVRVVAQRGRRRATVTRGCVTGRAVRAGRCRGSR